MRRPSPRPLVLALSLALCGLAPGCVGPSESEAWASDEEEEVAPPEDAPFERRRERDDRVSRGTRSGATRSGANRSGVSVGGGWRVDGQGRPVETFASAQRPAGFAPAAADAEPTEPKEPALAPARPAPWVDVPSQGLPATEAPKRTPLRLRANGVGFAPGECGPVPVARYGFDWRPEREWRLGQDQDPTPWLEPVGPLPLPPPAEVEPAEAPTTLEAEVPTGSWIEAR